MLSDENLLIKQVSKRQPISANLEKICLCSPNGDQCSYNTFIHCSKTVEKMSRVKRYITQEWMALPSLEREKIMVSNVPFFFLIWSMIKSNDKWLNWNWLITWAICLLFEDKRKTRCTIQHFHFPRNCRDSVYISIWKFWAT